MGLIPVDVKRRTNGKLDLSKSCFYEQEGRPKCDPDDDIKCRPCWAASKTKEQ